MYLKTIQSNLTANTPRLVWGYDPSLTTTTQAGNRFPSNIDEITIS